MNENFVRKANSLMGVSDFDNQESKTGGKNGISTGSATPSKDLDNFYILMKSIAQDD